MFARKPKIQRGSLLGSFEENILNDRLEPIRTVEGYRVELKASGHFQPRPLNSLVRVSFFSAGSGSFPYSGQIHIGYRGYRIPKKGTLQVTLFNPLGTIEKLFLLLYDLNDMPPNSQTFLRQRTILVPSYHNNNTTTTTNNNYCKPREQNCERNNTDNNSMDHKDDGSLIETQPLHNKQPKESRTRHVRHLIQFNIISSKSGRIYLNKDMRIFVSKKVDLEAASQLREHSYELRSFDEMPDNPRYFTR